MVRGLRSDLNPFFALRKHNDVFVKFAVSLFLVGLAFRLLFSDSLWFSSVVETPPALAEVKTDSSAISLPPQKPDSVNVPGNEGGKSLHAAAKCDLFVGDWVPDPSGPAYTNESCLDIANHQNCMMNGRPDSGYLYWRWKPRDCELAKFNAERFLNLMRHKNWAFIGDSISRNHVQSLLCILSQVEPAVEVYHDEEFKHRTWKFASHNFTLLVIWSPFLLKAAVFEDINGGSSSEIKLHLDSLDNQWTKQYNHFDYVVIAGGPWFLKTAIYYENNRATGCHYCRGKNLTELGFEHAYRKALQLVFNFLIYSTHKAIVFFRTITPDHFENGEWFGGGNCNRTVPFKESQIAIKDLDSILHNIELEEYKKAAASLGSKSSNRSVTFKLLDTTLLSLLRPDGHPGPYRHFQPFAADKNAVVQNDCLHWCLPGPIDSWNDLIMEMLVNGRSSQ